MSSPVHNRRITCLVSNDLAYDQRMLRVCSSLQAAGYDVTLLGRLKNPLCLLTEQNFRQIRFRLPWQKGLLFYATLNFRLFIYLLFHRADIIYAVDMDTLPAGLLAANITGSKCVYDAHEFYSESPELVERKSVRRFWSCLEKWLIRYTDARITVSLPLAKQMSDTFGMPFMTVRNLPIYYNLSISETESPFILYQGVLNLGRGLEEMINAMPHIPMQLYIAGEGDLSESLRKQVILSGLEEKVKFLGWLSPTELQALTCKAWLGINLLQPIGQSYRLSLANKFFDYVMAAVPVLCTPFEAYLQTEDEFHVAHWVSPLTAENIVLAVHELTGNKEKYETLKKNCKLARERWNWEQEQQVLLKLIEQLA